MSGYRVLAAKPHRPRGAMRPARGPRRAFCARWGGGRGDRSKNVLEARPTAQALFRLCRRGTPECPTDGALAFGQPQPKRPS
jgi:hypothetical protein